MIRSPDSVSVALLLALAAVTVASFAAALPAIRHDIVGVSLPHTVRSAAAPTVQAAPRHTASTPLRSAEADPMPASETPISDYVVQAQSDGATWTWKMCLGLLGFPLAALAWALRRPTRENRQDFSKALFGAGAAALLTTTTTTTPAFAIDMSSLVADPAPRVASRVAFVAEEALVEFLGRDTPPTSYGGYGGNANELPRYKFKHPASWKPLPVNKLLKGYQGVDSKLQNPADKREQCFTITLSRAGEEAVFVITDVESTFRGFAGADYQLSDSLEYAEEIIEGRREKDGQIYYDYDIVADNRYLATVTVKNGKVYAFFVNAPADRFNKNAELYQTMRNSFETLDAESTMTYNATD